MSPQQNHKLLPSLDVWCPLDTSEFYIFSGTYLIPTSCLTLSSVASCLYSITLIVISDLRLVAIVDHMKLAYISRRRDVWSGKGSGWSACYANLRGWKGRRHLATKESRLRYLHRHAWHLKSNVRYGELRKYALFCLLKTVSLQPFIKTLALDWVVLG